MSISRDGRPLLPDMDLGGPVTGPVRWADPAFPAEHYLFATLSHKAGDFALVAAALTLDIVDGPVRGQLSLAIDTSQNSDLTVYADGTRGIFPTRSLGAWLASGGAMLRVKF